MNSVVTKYLDDVIDVLAARAFQSAQQRLTRMLLKSARQIGRIEREGIALDLTNEQLAETAQVSLFTAARQLSEWQDRGILKKSRGKILLRAPQRLVGIHLGANDLHWNENEAARIPFADSSAYP
jgi:CRP-like cAMP-binding protein